MIQEPNSPWGSPAPPQSALAHLQALKTTSAWFAETRTFAIWTVIWDCRLSVTQVFCQRRIEAQCCKWLSQCLTLPRCTHQGYWYSVGCTKKVKFAGFSLDKWCWKVIGFALMTKERNVPMAKRFIMVTTPGRIGMLFTHCSDEVSQYM